jgi:hypothetical protein
MGYDVIGDLGRLCLLENYQSFGVQSYTSDARLHQQTSSSAGNALSNSKLLVHGTFEASPPNCVLILRVETLSVERGQNHSDCFVEYFMRLKRLVLSPQRDYTRHLH